MNILFFLAISFLLAIEPLSAAVHSSVHKKQEIKVPLGFAWNDPPLKLEITARSGGLTIVNQEAFPSSGKLITTVRGVVGNGLEQNLFTFRKNALVEIEYQYRDKNWSSQNYQDFFDAFRRMYDAKYGPGIQLINTTIKNHNRTGITSSLVGYQWSQAASVLELFYYTGEHQGQVYRLVSLHYQRP